MPDRSKDDDRNRRSRAHDHGKRRDHGDRDHDHGRGNRRRGRKEGGRSGRGQKRRRDDDDDDDGQSLPKRPKETPAAVPCTPAFFALSTKETIVPPFLEYMRATSIIDLIVADGEAQERARDCPHVALRRLTLAKRVERELRTACQEAGLRKEPSMAYDRWLFVQKSLEGTKEIDPVIPNGAVFDLNLAKELVEERLSPDDALHIVARLRTCAQACAAKVAEEKRCDAGSKCAREVRKRERSDGTFEVSWKKEDRFAINAVHHARLLKRYQGAGDGSNDPDEFDRCLFLLLARYTALGLTTYQAALVPAVFEVLVTKFGVSGECFASPLNATLEKYCSAFPDTDVPFGSYGRFFDFKPTTGSFEANPPFVEEMMKAMVEHMETLLEASPEALSFAVFIPAWTDTAAWEMMSKSKWTRRTLKITKRQHKYLVGDQHSARKQHWSANFHTGVFFLQNDAGKDAWPASDEATAALEEAFYRREER